MGGAFSHPGDRRQSPITDTVTRPPRRYRWYLRRPGQRQHQGGTNNDIISAMTAASVADPMNPGSLLAVVASAAAAT